MDPNNTYAFYAELARKVHKRECAEYMQGYRATYAKYPPCPLDMFFPVPPSVELVIHLYDLGLLDADGNIIPAQPKEEGK